MQIRSFEDLQRAIDVPEALWVALACPTTGLACDPRFLKFLDTDANGRIRVEELRAAVRWTSAMLDDTRGCDEGSSELELGWLSEEAKALKESAALVAEVLGLPGNKITLEDVRRSHKELRARGCNGDGIVAPEHMPREELAALARKILEILPGVTNRGGQVGVDLGTLEAFRAGKARGIARMDAKAEVFVWGEETLGRADQLVALAPKLDEYFLQCRLVAAQPEAGQLLRLPGERVPGVLGNREALDRATSALPIAPPNACGELRWSELLR
ncbi:MAG: kinesin, partial [Myxococcales bacterium]|nr:kinesin [Polyangiaceae bacterium]MDW8249006.1 kinesin [Myxococcales bacterium]